jgi:NAD(P)H dehydrogenase (quinone)
LSKILVTGASGYVGRHTLHLLERVPARNIAGLARDPAKGADLAKQGIETRQGVDFVAELLVDEEV